jgi:hypothetical protein
VERRTPLRKKVPMPYDPTCECFILQQQANAIHSTRSDESSTEDEPTSPDTSSSEEPPQVRDDKLDEARRDLEEEQARLHHELDMEAVATPTRECA